MVIPLCCSNVLFLELAIEFYFRQVEKRSKGGTKSGLPEVYCIVSPYGLFSLYSQVITYY